ncbi:MAG: methyltransferase domain-containing protein [Planctomycetes bacterium]|nr:methyltransferase domain-containing protein [Planctomycetota bacterium]
MIRDLAFRLLNKSIAVPSREVDQIARSARLEPRDRALLHDVVSGVARRMGTIDSVLSVYLRRNPERAVRTILRIGVYELVYLDRMPPHAVVSESVAVAGRRISGPTAGFVNAVLRAIATELQFEPLASYRPMRDRFPTETRVARFARPVLPDPATNPSGYLAAIHSLPAHVVDRWRARFGDRGAADAFRASNERPALTLRANTEVIERDALVEELRGLGYPAVPGDHALAVHLPARADGLFDSEIFKKGGFVVQDETQMRVADLLAPKPKEKVLDLCSAPGGKTTHLAQLAKDKADILAVDQSEDRVARVRESAERLKLKSIRTQVANALVAPVPGGPFDAVLVDAPCSNSGVLARRPEARWRINEDSLATHHQTQARLLIAGLLATKVGGRLVYSTCSVEPEENEMVVQEVVEQHKLAKVEKAETVVPAPGREGGYHALLIRI